MSERVVNLPNFVTLLRLIAAPLVVWLIYSADWQSACWLFLGAALSDGVDGFLARRLHQTTAFGATLDTVTDKALGLGSLIALTQVGAIPLWVTFAVLLRDTVVVLGALRYRGLTGRLDIQPTWLGKTHTFIEFGLLALVLANLAGMVELGVWALPLFALVFAVALLSGVQYVWLWSGKARRAQRGA
jgi:cardiolipin synthase